jgi:hypothetical protein
VAWIDASGSEKVSSLQQSAGLGDSRGLLTRIRRLTTIYSGGTQRVFTQGWEGMGYGEPPKQLGTIQLFRR